MDKWEAELQERYPRRRGGQYGNKNAKGHGAPKGNKNAEKHGAYSKIIFENLTEQESKLKESITDDIKENLMNEYRVLVIREYRIKNAIDKLRDVSADELFVDKVQLMETLKTKEERMEDEMQRAADVAAEIYLEDAGVYISKQPQSGEKLHMRITNNESAFTRQMRLEELLNRVQGRIAKVLEALKNCDNERERLELEHKRLELMRMRITGEIDIEPIEEEAEEPAEEFL